MKKTLALFGLLIANICFAQTAIPTAGTTTLNPVTGLIEFHSSVSGKTFFVDTANALYYIGAGNRKQLASLATTYARISFSKTGVMNIESNDGSVQNGISLNDPSMNFTSNDGLTNTLIQQGANSIVFYGSSSTFPGVQYPAHYWNYYNDYSLPDVGYVNSRSGNYIPLHGTDKHKPLRKYIEFSDSVDNTVIVDTTINGLNIYTGNTKNFNSADYYSSVLLDGGRQPSMTLEQTDDSTYDNHIRSSVTGIQLFATNNTSNATYVDFTSATGKLKTTSTWSTFAGDQYDAVTCNKVNANGDSTTKYHDGFNSRKYALKTATISGIILGNNLNSHSAAYGLSGTNYNGSASQSWKVDTTLIASKPYVNAKIAGISSSVTLTGDVTGTGTNTITTTLVTVNTNTGTTGGASLTHTSTINGKGLTTATGTVSIQIAESQVTNLTTDLAGKQATLSGSTSQLLTAGATTVSIGTGLSLSGGVLTSTATGGGGTTYTVTPPLAITGTVISIPAATYTSNGYLSSADYISFNKPQPYGVIFNDNYNRSSIGGNYSNIGSPTYTVSNGTLTLSGGNGFTTTGIQYDGYYIDEDVWRISYEYSCTNTNSGQYSLFSGCTSKNTANPLSMDWGLYYFSSNNTTAISVLGNSGSPVATSNTITVNVGDQLQMIADRFNDYIVFTAKNLSTGKTVSLTYYYNYISGAGASEIKPNTSKFQLFSPASNVKITNFNVSSKGFKNADVAFIGNSITAGYYVGADPTQRFNNIFGQQNNLKTVVFAGASDRTQEVLLDMPLILLHKSKYAVLEIGTNDVNGGISIGTIEANYASIVSQLEANGTIVYPATLLPRNGQSNTVFNSWILSTYGSNHTVIRYDSVMVDPSTPGNINPLYTVDGTHPNTAGAWRMANYISDILLNVSTNATVDPFMITNVSCSDNSITFNPTNGSVLGSINTSNSNIWASTQTFSASVINGSGGNGFLELKNQSSAPSTPGTSNIRLSSLAANFSWIQSNGFSTSLANSITANRTITLPDVNTTMLGKTGTMAANYIGYYNDANQLTGSTTLQYDGTNNLTLAGGASNINIKANIGSNPSVTFYDNGTFYGAWGVSGGSGNLITGSVLGDQCFRGQGTNVLFSTNSGTSSMLTLTSAGNAVFTGSVSIGTYEAFKGITASATLDFPSTSGSTTSTLTVSVTGASVGDPVDVGAGNTQLSKSLYVAQVTATNVVTVTFVNIDPINTQDPASGTFKLKVLK